MNPEIWFPNLGIEIWHLDRVAINVFGLPIYWYGIIMVSAILAAIAYVGREAGRTGQNPDWYYDLALYAIIGAMIGSRTYYVAFSWDNYKDNLIKIFALREGGLALYGSLIGGTLTVLAYTRLKKYSFMLAADTILPGFMLAQAIGRWGNFINREAFGGFTDSFLAMRYLASTVSYIPASVMESIVSIKDGQYIQVHPTFLYECLWNLTGFAIIMRLKVMKKFNGQIAAYYCIIYGVGRFWIEGLRTDQLQIGTTGIAISQVISIVIILAASAYLFYNRNNKSVIAISNMEEAAAEIGSITDDEMENQGDESGGEEAE